MKNIIVNGYGICTYIGLLYIQKNDLETNKESYDILKFKDMNFSAHLFSYFLFVVIQ